MQDQMNVLENAYLSPAGYLACKDADCSNATSIQNPPHKLMTQAKLSKKYSSYSSESRC